MKQLRDLGFGLLAAICCATAVWAAGATWTLPCTNDIINCTGGTYNLGTMSLTTSLTTPKVIGTSSNLILQPSGDSTTGVQINKAGAGANILNVDTTNARVGIGTTAPLGLLELKAAGPSFVTFGQAITTYAGVTFQDAAIDVTNYNLIGNATDTRLGVPSGGSVGLYVANLAKVAVRSNGTVGIGTALPTEALTVKGHLSFMGTIPTVTAGGCTTNTVTTKSTDAVGEVTLSGTCTTVTSITITFNLAHTTRPVCHGFFTSVNAGTTTTLVPNFVKTTDASATNTMVLTFAGNVVSGDKVGWHCLDNDTAA